MLELFQGNHAQRPGGGTVVAPGKAEMVGFRPEIWQTNPTSFVLSDAITCLLLSM